MVPLLRQMIYMLSTHYRLKRIDMAYENIVPRFDALNMAAIALEPAMWGYPLKDYQARPHTGLRDQPQSVSSTRDLARPNHFRNSL